jgi:hypothetical protein
VESLHEQDRNDNDESSIITLSGLYGQLQPSMRTMSLLHRIIQETKYCKGGKRLKNYLEWNTCT